MHLTLHPHIGLPGQTTAALHVRGDVLTHDGVAYDLSPVPEGGEGVLDTPDSPFSGPIRRIGGVIHAPLKLRLGDEAEDEQPGGPWTIPDADGDVAIPAVFRPVAEMEAPE